MSETPRCRLIPFVVAVLVALLALAGCASAPTLAGDERPPLDLQRMMGTWYVIAHVPYFTERGQVSARDEYSPLADGRIAVRYVYRNGFRAPVKSLDAVATVVPGSGNREWVMRFFRIARVRQQILEVAPDGSWALVAAPDRDLAWVFARRADMDGKTYQGLLHKLRDHGINSDKLWRVPQVPAQVGGLGFERPNEEDVAADADSIRPPVSSRRRPAIFRRLRGRHR